MTYFGRRDPQILFALTTSPAWLPGLTARLSGYPNPADCWTWEGCRSKGYGQTGIPNRGGKVGVHRVIWLAMVGPIQPEYVLDHDGPMGCHNRACANPAHLAAVTVQYNTVVTGSGPAADHARRTHCCSKRTT